MTIAPAPSYQKREQKRALTADRARSSAPTATSRSSENTHPIEIVAPDRYCTVLLLGYAAPSFEAEIVSGPGWRGGVAGS